MNSINKIDITKYKLVIFDIDGTLYNQKKLRLKMIFNIIIYYLFKPLKIYELKILKIFREEREKNKGTNSDDLENEQYSWVVKKTNYSIEIIKNIVIKWILKRPLGYLYKCKYSGVDRLFLYLKENGIKIGIYSDYPTKEKLEYLGLDADIEIASTDREVNAFKPDPKGLFYIINKLDIKKEDCLFIGDREETDGQCAKNAEMDYLIIDKDGKVFNTLIKYETN